MAQHVVISLFPMEEETEDEYRHRMFTTAKEWIPNVFEQDVPSTGVARTIWNNYLTIRSFTDDELAEEYFNCLESNDALSLGWWGVVSRSWLDLIRVERARRYEARN